MHLKQLRSAYAAALEILNAEIEELEKKRTLIQISPSFESDITELNEVKFQSNQKASEISGIQLRINIISEAREKIALTRSEIDIAQLKQIYEQANSLIAPMQKTFEDLVQFHNKMVEAKVRFIEKDLPELQAHLLNLSEDLQVFHNREIDLNSRIVQGDSFVDLEHTLAELNSLHQKKGEYESVVAQLGEVEDKLDEELDSTLTAWRDALLEAVRQSPAPDHIADVGNMVSAPESGQFDDKALRGLANEMLDYGIAYAGELDGDVCVAIWKQLKRRLATLLARAPRAEGWISVKDPPKAHGKYLCYSGGTSYRVLYWDGDDWSGENMAWNPRYYTPLPEPPKEGV